jgi:predicted nucleic acid-binding protein
MSVADAEQYLITVFRPLLAIHSSAALYVDALRIAGKYRLAWYDCLIVAAALQSQCGVLYSEDLQHGQKIDGLLIENPFI